MIIRFLYILLVILSVSCAPTRLLNLDIMNPAEFSFPDSGKIAILNTSYRPMAMHRKDNLMSKLNPEKHLIFDSLITKNLFDGLFSVLNISPVTNLMNAEYYEIRASDTINFFNRLSKKSVKDLCEIYNVGYIIALEYYSFNFRKFAPLDDPFSKPDFSFASNQLVWRIYNKEGNILKQFTKFDNSYWDNYYYPDLLPDALCEIFYKSGEKFGMSISPYWSTTSRLYYLISEKGEDISFERDKLIQLKSSDKKILAFKACYNLAVLNELEDNLAEAYQWLEEAIIVRQSETVEIYKKTLENRMKSREKLNFQVSFK